MSIAPVWARWLTLAALLVLAYGLGFVKGDDHGTEKLTEYVGQQAAASMLLLQARQAAIDRVVVKWKTRVETVVKEGEKIYVRVPELVTPADDAGCVVPVGFVRSYNAAVANREDSEPPAASDRHDSGVSLSTVAQTEAFNLSIAHRWKARAEECIAVYNAVRDAQAE